MLSIIIVNYKTPQLILDCLTTIYDQAQNLQFEILIVDNASEDNSRQLITTAFPTINWIQLPYNAGFARANNRGINQSKGDVVLLLNSDTLNVENAVERCYREFSISEYAACGVQLLNRDGSHQISGNYAIKGGLNYLLPLPYIGSFLKFLADFTGVKKPNVPSTSELVEVDWINGAFLMVKKSAIEKAGLLDEDFFLYAEEAEWCSRLRKVGKLCIYGQYNVIHLQGETANATFDSSGKGYYNLYDRKGLQIILSNFVRIRKEFGPVWFIFHLLTYSIAIPFFFIGSFIENLVKFKSPFNDFRNASKFTKNMFKIWGFSFKILSNKPYFYKVL